MDKAIDKEDKENMERSYRKRVVVMDKVGNCRQPTRLPIVSSSFSLLVYINHLFQPTGLLHFSFVSFVRCIVCQFQINLLAWNKINFSQ